MDFPHLLQKMERRHFSSCLFSSRRALRGWQIKKTCTHTHSQPSCLLPQENTHAVKSIKNHHLGSKQDLKARGGEEVIWSRSASDFRAGEQSWEKRCPSFNSATKPKQKPHPFSLITPRCRMWSTYIQSIYHKSQSTFYTLRRCYAL